MDFPQFFRTAIQNLTVKSDRWRGLALLVKRPDTLLGARGALEDVVLPVTGSTFQDRDCPIHVMEKPMMGICFVPSSGLVLAGRPGVRFHVHSYNIAIVKTAADTGSLLTIYGIQNGAVLTLAAVGMVTLAAEHVNASGILDVNLDVGTGISAALTGTITTGNCTLAYHSVGAS